MILSQNCVGIDVSKHFLDIFEAGVRQRIANHCDTITEHAARWAQAQAFVVFEATGTYDGALGAALQNAGVRFARVNPARVRDFARACGRIAKTDAIDAEMLARYAQALKPAPAAPPSEARKTLALMAKRRDQLIAMRVQEKNRRENDHPFMAEQTARAIAFLNGEIAALDAAIAQCIAADAELSRDAQLLRSAPGVGPVAALQLLARMPELGRIGPKQIASLAGLAPMNVDSGAFRGKRSIKGGRKRVRDALYMAALNAARSAGFKAFYLRLRDAGKPAKLALIALARKLLGVLNAILRTQKPYNPSTAT